MYGKVLVATDGSKPLWRGLPLVAQIAGSGAPAHVFHVPSRWWSRPYTVTRRRESWGLETPREAAELVQKWAEELRARHLPTDGAVATQLESIAALILREGRDFQADLLVVGSRGISPFRGLLIGSVSHVVLQLARCAVLVVRGRPPRKRVARVLLACDGSRQARQALRTAALLADRLEAEVVVAHSAVGGGPVATRMVSEAVEDLGAQGVEAKRSF
jgi:nucleotide-binding universal stress UspA family protein